jgi:uncharacterized protein
MPRSVVSDIPVVWEEPTQLNQRNLVIWLPGLTDSKESMHSYLKELASAGYVALSFDPVDHGERSRFDELPIDVNDGSFRADIDGKTYRHFWSILAETVEETSRVIDWAITQLGVTSTVGVGGKSMGGDIAVAAAGHDGRIAVVAACIATPDWLKPGSIYRLSAPNGTIQKQYERYNPLTNLNHYQHHPAISFQCGAEDTMVPPDGAARFVEKLRSLYQNSPERLELVLERGVGHELTETMWRNSLAWFRRFLE